MALLGPIPTGLAYGAGVGLARHWRDRFRAAYMLTYGPMYTDMAWHVSQFGRQRRAIQTPRMAYSYGAPRACHTDRSQRMHVGRLFYCIILRDDAEFNIRFCEEVEKQATLYDYARAEYSNRNVQVLLVKLFKKYCLLLLYTFFIKTL